MGEAEDVLTICTSLGYAKVMCAADTTVKELIGMAMRTVSLMSSSQLYGLQTPREDHNLNSFRHILCRNLTWAEIKKLFHPTELTLAICLFPTKFEEAARNDRSTLFYLHQQAKEIYHAHFNEITDVAMAFEIGCLDIRSFASSSDPCTKDLLDVLDKGRGLNSFFPPCVLQTYKSKALRRAVQNYLVKVQHYSEEDCALDMLNRYLILLKFDRDVIRCSFGAGQGFPVEMVIGPRFQVSIMLENAAEPRTVAYFASIKKVMVSKTVGSDGVRYQVRLAIEQSNDPNAPLEIMTFSFQSQEAADTVVHLLEGYCGEAIGAAIQDNGYDVGSSSANPIHRVSRDIFLPNGCPYRLKESTNREIQKLEMPRGSVILEQVLGEGQFGDVYKGIYRKESQTEAISVAVKTCKIDASPEERGQFLEEARILSEFNHPHIIRLLGVCSEEPIWLVMEYAPLGELRHYLIARNGQIAYPLLLTFCYQIVAALTCLESKRCVHRDIAARNILVARSDWVKLADFGMAKILYDADEFRADKGRKMPIKWMAPESVHHRRFSSASDVWMFGVCMWEILSGGTKPFADMTNAEAAEHVTRGQRLKRPEICPRNLYVIMLECWNTNPQRRPTFAALKPRLRELAAQSREVAKSDYQNSEKAGSPTNPEAKHFIPDRGQTNSHHHNSGKTSPTCKSRTNHQHSTADRTKVAQNALPHHDNSSSSKLPSVRSRWEEVTELETPIGGDGGNDIGVNGGSDSDSARYDTTPDFHLDNGVQKKHTRGLTDASDMRPESAGNTVSSSRSRCAGNNRHQHHSNRQLSPVSPEWQNYPFHSQ
ncbi:PTK2 protein tyrosine kinase 2 [Fasciolopsis buskii]|uniref:non-specific protein-tyrosine kinase n=1 Tax=Fasciolopsis buskii TaxID=27845 RepID=A0A8E0SA99_9TREM|nr:PTK2 protein tyrosine kinase 2 [Fasciolopsis buski]